MLEYDFKRPQLEDKEIITHYFKHHTSRSCERTFDNVFLWARFYNVTYAVIENTLVFKSEGGGRVRVRLPGRGKRTDVKRALDALYPVQPGEGRPLPPVQCDAGIFRPDGGVVPGPVPDRVRRGQRGLRVRVGEALHAGRQEASRQAQPHQQVQIPVRGALEL